MTQHAFCLAWLERDLISRNRYGGVHSVNRYGGVRSVSRYGGVHSPYSDYSVATVPWVSLLANRLASWAKTYCTKSPRGVIVYTLYR
jgi:hypothetical protein